MRPHQHVFPDGRNNGTWLPKTVLATADSVPLLTYPLKEKSFLGFEPAAVQVTLRTKSGVRASYLCLPGAGVAGVHPSRQKAHFSMLYAQLTRAMK